MSSKITINGMTITAGRSIVVQNGKVIIDGKDVTPDAKAIDIRVEGNIDRIEADACNKIVVSGDVGSVSTQAGDVEVSGNIQGSVNSMSGNVIASGSIGGPVSTMSGNIVGRK